MQKAFIINAHHPSEISKGALNAELVRRIERQLRQKGYDIQHSASAGDWTVEDELAKHVWADVVILQSPVNWMGVPWTMKRYMDEVYTAGMFGALCQRDGRTSDHPKANYGTGGVLHGKKYMLSLTFNAPREAFDADTEYLFQGRGVDDLWMPAHMNFRFFAMEPIPTFVCYDVMKNPEIEQDFERLSVHLDAHF